MKKTKTAELTEKLAVVEKANGDLTSQVSGLNLRLANQAQVLSDTQRKVGIVTRDNESLKTALDLATSTMKAMEAQANDLLERIRILSAPVVATTKDAEGKPVEVKVITDTRMGSRTTSITTALADPMSALPISERAKDSISQSSSITFGDANRTMVTLSRFYNEMDGTKKDNETMKRLIDTFGELFYVDLEN